MGRKYESWENATKAFIDSYQYGRDKRTVVAKESLLRHTHSIPGKPADFQMPDFVEFINEFARTRKPSTVKNLKRAIKDCLEYIGHPLYRDLKNYRIPIPLGIIPTYTDEELEQITEWCLQEHSTKGNQRLSIYLLIAMTSALRASEICALRWENWNPEDCRFRVLQTKTKVARWALVAEFAVPYINRWRDESESEWVIPAIGRPGNCIGAKAIRVRMNEMRKSLGFEQFNTKKFRATVARIVFESSRDLEETAAILGHESIETTRRFYHRIGIAEKTTSVYEQAFAKMNKKNKMKGELE